MSQVPSLSKADKLLPSVKEWKKIVDPHTKPSTPRATWQVVNSIGSYIALWVAMYFTLAISYWLTFTIALLAGAILVRVFIIFHDCGHGSFYKSRRANNIIGFISGIFTFTPYSHWKWEHSIHHSASGDLDRRGTGDVWTMTVDEYLGSSLGKRFIYRSMRNPFILFIFAPLYLFIIRERFATPGAKPRFRRSVWAMNLAIGLLAGALILIFGWLPYLLLVLTSLPSCTGMNLVSQEAHSAATSSSDSRSLHTLHSLKPLPGLDPNLNLRQTSKSDKVRKRSLSSQHAPTEN